MTQATPSGAIWEFVAASQRPAEAQIMANWQTLDQPRVSVICLTFNHVAFLEDALTGILLQNTDFAFEILIYDDASTDGTSDLVRRFAAEYPQIVRPIIRPENTYSQGFMPRIFNVEEARGDYLAVCEGDDFWVDPNKMQRQFDYLEAHPDVVLSGHDAQVLTPQGLAPGTKLVAKHRSDADAATLARCDRHVLTLTMMYRNLELPEPFERNLIVNGDSFMNSLIGTRGGYHFHHDIAHAVYREHAGGVWSEIGKRKQMESQANLFFWLSCFHKRHGNTELGQAFERKFLTKSNDIRLTQSRSGRLRLKFTALRRSLRRGKKRAHKHDNK